jgi:membrane-bound lytic murein transglycosylase D
MHNQYDDWLVALAAYNCGPGNVRKAMRYSGKKDFWGIYDYLPRETQNYVPKYIAMTYLMNFYDAYGIIPAPIDPIEFDTESVYCKKGLDFTIIAKKLDMTNEELLHINPEIKTTKIPYTHDGYFLNIPSNKYHEFYGCQDELIIESKIRAEQIRLEEAKKPKHNYYIVRRGDCLPIIARKFGITVAQLKSWNNLRGSLIYPNQRLRISN